MGFGMHVTALLLLLLLHVPPAAAQPVPALALSAEQLSVLPQRDATLSFGNPPASHRFEGPLLWDVLVSSGTLDPARHGDTVRQWLQFRAADGYTAVVALGEIAPEFAGRPAILAVRMDGMPLDRPRLVMPDELRAGRSARDVVAVSVETLPDPRR